VANVAISAALVRRYEILTLNTAPALTEHTINGWRLRASGTDTRRSNSATCLDHVDAPHYETIDAIEAWFASHRQERVFRMTDLLTPPGMDTALAERGYQYAIDCHFMTRPIAAIKSTVSTVPFKEISLEAGTTLLHELKSMDPAKAQIELARQQLWQGKQRFLMLEIDDEPAAIGLGRIEDEHVGIFSMHTAAKFRGQGFAGALLDQLSRWGADEGAHTSFLQVEADNSVAMAVYEKAGFVPAYSYWHRIK
jgi:predicted GNAT family acetyltransferase